MQLRGFLWGTFMGIYTLVSTLSEVKTSSYSAKSYNPEMRQKLTGGKDLDKEDDELPQRRVSGQEAQEAFNREIEQRKRKERSQNRVLHGMV
jgi:hypothetical protein